MDNTELYLLDNHLQLVKQGEIGELFVSGFNLAAGYVAGRDPDKFVNNPFTSKLGNFCISYILIKKKNFTKLVSIY